MSIIQEADLNKLSKEVRNNLKGYPNKSLLLTGGVGTGKTFTVIAILKHFNQDLNAHFYKFNDFLREFRACETCLEESSLMKEFVGKRHLVIDDFGTEKLTDYAYSIIIEFIDKRLLYNKSHLIITTNLSLKDIANVYDIRLSSRMIELFRIVKFEGKDLRLEKAKQNQKI